MTKLLIPSLVLAASVALGCSTNSAPGKDGGAGTGGTAGSAGGTTGAAGHTGGTAGAAGGATGAAGHTSGTAGSAGGAAGGTAGTTGAAGLDGGTDATGVAGTPGSDGGGANIAALKLECPTKVAAMNAATPFSAADFCALYESVCGAENFSGALTPADCETKYTSWASMKIMGSTTVGIQNCTSYHLCNANAGMPALHCQHAAAKSVCNP